MKYVKVLDKNLCPLIQGGKPYEIDVWHHCEDFDTSDTECAPGFYVIPVSELIHYHEPWLGTKVLPAEIKGSSRIFTAAKQRYEYMKLDNPLSDEEIKKLCKEIEPELGYKLSEALYPVNPLLLPKTAVTDKDIKLLRQWDSVQNSVGCRVWDSVKNSVWDSVGYRVWDSVKNSVGCSVWDSVKNSVRNSVRNSVQNSVWNSVWAYIGSLFPNIGKWEYKTTSTVNIPSNQQLISGIVVLFRHLMARFGDYIAEKKPK